MATPVRYIELLRVGHPLLVGQYPDRVVPTFVFHHFAAPLCKADPKRLLSATTAAFNPNWSRENGLQSQLPRDTSDFEELKEVVQGILNPDRRMFADRKRNIAGTIASNTFPITSAYVHRSGADEGLGRRCFVLLRKFNPEVLSGLKKLLSPAESNDPLTSFANVLMGDPQDYLSGQDFSIDGTGEEIFTDFDKACSNFLANLIVDAQDAARITVIRDLEIGLQFVGVMQMTSGFLARRLGSVPPVIVYGGMPPGSPNDPVVRYAAGSYSRWTAKIWGQICEALKDNLDSITPVDDEVSERTLLQRIKLALIHNKVAEREREKLLSSVETTFAQRPGLDIFGFVETGLNFPPLELARRIRALSQSIGFTAPDRGVGSVRLVFDTPLLNVLIRGLVGRQSVNYEDFVSLVAEKFGLVLGPGAADDLLDRYPEMGEGNIYESLLENQDLLQQRLLRAGFARAYSDSHTEVLAYSLNLREGLK